MNLLCTFTLPHHNLYIYDTIDPDMIESGHIHTTVPMNQSHCAGVGCTRTPCYFQTPGGSCTSTIATFIRSNLISTNPEYFI